MRASLSATIAALLVLASPLRGQSDTGRRLPDRTSSTRARPADTTALVLPRSIEARSIGPAAMGGRASTIAFDPQTPTTYYAGFGTGGVMKTTDNGVTFSAIFEHEKVAAIGDIAVAPSDPHVIWLGTGEANDRNSVMYGDGVYRSVDGGSTWTNVGLKDSKAIARIAIHPTDPKTAYVAVIGDLWMPNAERGLYKTTDAGATWHKVLGAARCQASRRNK